MLAGVGVGDDTIERVTALVEAGVDIIAVDSAHGHSKGVLDKISEIKMLSVTRYCWWKQCITDAAEALIKAGANVLKVGVVAWFYLYHQSSSRSWCSLSYSSIFITFTKAKEYNVAVIADGGIKLSGDIVKAIASVLVL